MWISLSGLAIKHMISQGKPCSNSTCKYEYLRKNEATKKKDFDVLKIFQRYRKYICLELDSNNPNALYKAVSYPSCSYCKN